MSTAAISSEPGVQPRLDTPIANKPDPGARGSWWRFLLILVVTLVVLIPIIAVVGLALQPALGSTSTARFTLENFVSIFRETDVLTWLRNSMTVTLVTVVVSVVVAAPAGYVLSRGRGRLISGFSLVLFPISTLLAATRSAARRCMPCASSVPKRGREQSPSA